jgi:hypothetical protein
VQLTNRLRIPPAAAAPPTVTMIIIIAIQSHQASADYIHAGHLGFHRQHFAGKAHRERQNVCF